MALFGEKYGSEVRVLSMGDGFSVELCGGTHTKRTGDIGLFRIVSESGVAAGVRRIEAISGKHALASCELQQEELNSIGRLLKSNKDKVVEKVEQLVKAHKKLEKEVDLLKTKLATSSADDLLSQATEVGGIKVLAIVVDGVDPKALRDMVDQLKNKLQKSVVILASTTNGKISLVAGVTKVESAKIKAGALMQDVCRQIDGKGGGRPDMAQGGGSNVDALPKALAQVASWVSEQIEA